jgi:hypothetical protein
MESMLTLTGDVAKVGQQLPGRDILHSRRLVTLALVCFLQPVSLVGNARLEGSKASPRRTQGPALKCWYHTYKRGFER